ncbi:unnamed protein product [Sphacelaria rigidula]
MATHRSRDCPDRNCGKCGKKGYQLLDCPKFGEDVVMAMGLVSDVVDDDSICSDADAEAFISMDITKAAEDTTASDPNARRSEG